MSVSEFFVAKSADDDTAGKVDPVNVSVFGKTIPLMFGAARILCAPVWAAPVVTNYDGSRVVTFAAMAGKRDPLTSRAVVLRVWMDGVLAYTTTAGEATASPQPLSFVFYDGSEGQQKDPTIVANEGEPRTPGFRDRMYFVITGWNVAIGAKFPEVTAEIVQYVDDTSYRLITPFATSLTYPSVEPPGVSFGEFAFVSIETDIFWTLDYGSGHVQATLISEQALYNDFKPMFGSQQALPITASRNLPEIYCMSSNGSFPTSSFGAWNRNGQQTCSYTFTDGPGATLASVSWPTAASQEYVITATYFAPLAIELFRRNGGDLDHIDSMTCPMGAASYCAPAFVDQRPHTDANDYVMAYGASGTRISVHFWPEDGSSAIVGVQTARYTASDGYPGGKTIVMPMSALPTSEIAIDLASFGLAGDIQFLLPDPSGKFLYGMMLNQTTGNQWFKLETPYNRLGNLRPGNSGGVPNPPPTLMDITDLNLIDWFVINGVDGNFTLGSTMDNTGRQGTPVGQTEVMFRQQGGGFKIFDMATGDYQVYPRGTFRLASAPDTNIPLEAQLQWTGRETWVKAKNGAFYPSLGPSGGVIPKPGFVTMYPDADGGATLALSTYFKSLSLLSGFQATDIDTSSLLETVGGSIINVQTDFLTLVPKIASLFRVDIFESEGKIKFSRHERGPTVLADRVLTEHDLAPLTEAAADDGSLLSKERDPTATLPQTAQVTYLDSDNDYELGGQIARRTQFPFRTTAGSGQLTVDIPVAMHASEALYWVEFMLYDMWAEALTITARGSAAQLDLEPGDWIEFSTQNFGDYIVKLTEVSVNGDYSVSLTGTTVLATPPDNTNISTIAVKSLDVSHVNPTGIPEIAVIDNFAPVNQVGHETRASFYILSRTPIDMQYKTGTALGTSSRVPSSCNFGYIIAALPAIYAFDTPIDDQSITARFETAPTSASDDDFLSGRSAVVIGDTTNGWEMILFRDVTTNADGSYTLSHIVRGWRGTDTVPAAAKGAQAIIIPPDVMPQACNYDVSVAGSTIEVDFNLPGRSITGKDYKRQLFQATAGNLKPWAPVHVACAHSGSDIVITWNRRDRSVNSLHDGDAFVPLAETSAQFSVDIYHAGSIVRTVNALSTETYTYLSADQTTDGNGGASTLQLAVYQVSALVGRGRGRIVTCPVN